MAALLAVVAAACAGGGSYLSVRRYLNTHQALSDLGGTHGPSATGSSTASPTPSGSVSCPQPTIDAVKAKGGPGHLSRVLHVEGTSAKGNAEAWICRDDNGTLYYQGHDKSGPLGVATGDYTILVGGLIRGSVTFDGSRYIASNPDLTGDTRYIVSRSTFSVIHPDGSKQDYTLVKVEG